jgi:hypothetical protein
MNKLIVIHTVAGRENWLKNCLNSLKDYGNSYDIKCNPTHYPIYIIITGQIELSDSFKFYLNSLSYPLIYAQHTDWETGVIAYIHTIFQPEHFIYLHDSIEIKDTTLFDLSFKHPNSVYYFHRFMSYMGKYKRTTLNKIQITQSYSKQQACINEDKDALEQYNSFMWQYFKIETPHWLFPGLNDTNIFEEKFGRKNMILENQYLKKYKGHWNWSMIKET